uniref:Uncharacterized protein n=1 Tax=Tanacetum cinerariifolium TaxID=118510 RepID=A0A6L2L0V9_TANCI|nr:hypothetical protein [Tanacetum cinerariifolium]
MRLAEYYIVFKTIKAIKGQALPGDLPVCSGVKGTVTDRCGELVKQEGAQVRRMMGSGRWKGKIEEMHWKTWCITVRWQQREPCDEDSMLESVMSEDATREALRTAEDTPVVEAGIKVEFSEEEGAVESDVALDFK